MIGNLSAAIFTPGAVLGDYESIATVAVTSNQSTISFNSIPSTFQHLQIRALTRMGAAFSGTFALHIRFNGDSGSNYTQHVLFGNGSSASAAAATSQAQGSIVNQPGDSETSNSFGVVVCDILDYKDTNKYSTFRGLGGYDGNNTNGIVTLRSGVWMNTAAITSISLFAPPSDQIVPGSHFALYGIKG